MFCRAYKNEIDAGKARMNASRNGFVRQCCQQTIDQLTAEKRAIEAGYIEPSVDEQFGSGQPNRIIVTLPLVQKDYPNDHHRGDEKGDESRKLFFLGVLTRQNPAVENNLLPGLSNSALCRDEGASDGTIPQAKGASGAHVAEL